MQFQAFDNNDNPIAPREGRIVTHGGDNEAATLDDIPEAVDAMLRPAFGGAVERPAAHVVLRTVERETARLATELMLERNRLREKHREVLERTRPPWLTPLTTRLRAFVDRLPDSQYAAFLERWKLTDDGFGRWLDFLKTGIDLDDGGLVRRLQSLEANPAAIIEEFGALRDIAAIDDGLSVSAAGVQLELDLWPVVRRVQGRITNLRINLPSLPLSARETQTQLTGG